MIEMKEVAHRKGYQGVREYVWGVLSLKKYPILDSENRIR